MAWSSLIDILTRGRKSGYLVRETHSLAFFPNNTLCLRRRVIEETGGYDESLQASEDVDLCARIARDRWLMFQCPDMTLRHRARPGLFALLKQWWGYGLNIPRVYRKYSPGMLEVYAFWPPDRFVRVAERNGLPSEVCLFLHPFFVMHVAAAGWLFTDWLPLLALTAAALALYIQPDLKGSLPVALIRYALNVVFTLSHVVGGLKTGSLYLPNVVSERRD